MKKVVLLTLMFLTLNVTFAQTVTPTETMAVNVEDLDAITLAKVKAKQTQAEIDEKIKTYGSWVGIGKEVGVAVDEGLTAVTKHATSIADTKLGKVTMFIIAYKVIGKDIIRYCVGLFLFLIITIVMIISYFKNATDRKLKTITHATDGKTVLKTEEKIKECSGETQLFHALIYGIGLAIICMIMFI
jgi:hypothetical protein